MAQTPTKNNPSASKPKIYIIGICSSEGNGVISYRVIGTEAKIRSHLANLVKEDKKNDPDEFDFGTTKASEIYLENDGRLQAYATYHDYHIDYTATPEQEPESL